MYSEHIVRCTHCTMYIVHSVSYGVYSTMNKHDVKKMKLQYNECLDNC